MDKNLWILYWIRAKRSTLRAVIPVMAGMLMLLSACTASRQAYNPTQRFSPEDLREDYDLLRKLMAAKGLPIPGPVTTTICIVEVCKGEQ